MKEKGRVTIKGTYLNKGEETKEMIVRARKI